MTRAARRRAPAACTTIGRWVIMAGLILMASPASAKILKTRRPAQPGQELLVTVGSGFDYQTDGEQSEYGFPFLLEYGFTPRLKLSVEPSVVSIHGPAGRSVSGFGDLETTVNYEFLSQRRHRPGLAVVGGVKWPTATRAEIGTGRADYSIGTIVSKEFVPADVDFNAVYTRVGDPPGVRVQNTLEASLAAEWHLNLAIDLVAELLTSSGAGGVHGRAGPISGAGGGGGIGVAEQGGRETEGTLGLAEHLNEFLKLEQGAVLKSGGSWQAVIAWEWDFGGGR